VQPHAILLDLGLPGLDGYEVARRLRASGFAEVVLIAVTGYGDTEHKRRCQEAGFDHHLLKPVDLAKLRQLLFSL
jgi:CheY-like chemotaxis protein